MHKKRVTYERNEVTTNSLIQDEKSIVEWCSSIMGEGTGTHEDQSHRKGHVHRYLWEVVDVDRS
jgi:hypothetical protein